MPRAINSYMKPADIVQQYEYYNYPVAQLIELVKHKDAQQVKAIDAIGAYDDELGKYENLPGDEQTKADIIQKYTTLKSNTINQDLTGRKGHQVLFKFKDDLRTSVLPELQKIDKSAKLWKEDYTREAKKFGEGKSLVFTLTRLNDIAKNHNTSEKGVYTPTSRGEFMDFATFVKEKNPKLLDGSWNPNDMNLNYTKIFDSGYDQQFSKLATKSISAADLMLAGKDYINYLRNAGFEEDINYSYKKAVAPEQAALAGREMHVNVKLAELQQNAQNFIDNKKLLRQDDKLKTATQLGVDVGVINNLLSENVEIRKAAYKQIEDVQKQKLNQEYDALTSEKQIENGYKSLTSSFYGSLTQPFIEQYAGDITDFKIDKFDTDNYILKKQYEHALKKKEIEYAQSVQEANENQFLRAEAVNMTPENFEKNLTGALSLRTQAKEVISKLESRENSLKPEEREDLEKARKNLEETSWVETFGNQNISTNNLSSGVRQELAAALVKGTNTIIATKTQRGTTLKQQGDEKLILQRLRAADKNAEADLYMYLNNLNGYNQGLGTKTIETYLTRLNPETRKDVERVLGKIYSQTAAKDANGKISVAQYGIRFDNASSTYKSLATNINSVMDGDEIKSLTPDEKATMQIFTNGKIIVNGEIYDATKADKQAISNYADLGLIKAKSGDMNSWQGQYAKTQELLTSGSQRAQLYRGIDRAMNTSLATNKEALFDLGNDRYKIRTAPSADGSKYYFIQRDINKTGNFVDMNTQPLTSTAEIQAFVSSIQPNFFQDEVQ